MILLLCSYLIDYVLVIVLFVVGGVVFDNITTYKMFVPPNDPGFSYPHVSETVPTWAVIVYGVGGPIACFAIYQVMFNMSFLINRLLILCQIWARSLHDFHHATLGVLEGFAFSVFFSGLIKIWSGKYVITLLFIYGPLCLLWGFCGYFADLDQITSLAQMPARTDGTASCK